MRSGKQRQTSNWNLFECLFVFLYFYHRYIIEVKVWIFIKADVFWTLTLLGLCDVSSCCHFLLRVDRYIFSCDCKMMYQYCNRSLKSCQIYLVLVLTTWWRRNDDTAAFPTDRNNFQTLLFFETDDERLITLVEEQAMIIWTYGTEAPQHQPGRERKGHIIWILQVF